MQQLRPMLPVALPALVAAIYGWAVFVSTFKYPGAIGFNYIAPGSDWMVMYGTARLAMTNHLGLTRDSSGFESYINIIFAHWLPQPLLHRPWVYPPSFLLILMPFGVLGFTASYVAFQAVTAALLAAALLYKADRRRAAPWIALAALACPAASINVIDGQGGFLVAGLLVLGFRLLAWRPLLAGAVLGIVSVKPQFGLMVPIALLAMRQWRGIAGAALSSLSLVAASAIAFGPQTWLWWADQTAFSYGTPGSEWASFGRLWGSSVYACAALLHASPLVSLLLQACAIVLAAAAVYRVYRLKVAADRRLAILLAATILAAPHVSPYDMVLLTAAGGLWFAGMPAPDLKAGIVLLVLWVTPMLGPPAIVPIGRAEPLVILGFIALAFRTSLPGKILPALQATADA